jgi:TonB family protein
MLLRSFLLFALLALPSIGRTAHVRAPTHAWTVDFAEAQCLAVRDYGTPENPVQLVLKAPAIGDVIQVSIIREASWTGATQVAGRVAIDGARPFEISILTHSPRHSKFRVYSINMTATQFALVRQASELSVRTDGLDERFALTQMTPLLRVVDRCVTDLRQVFNVTDSATGETSRLQRRATTTTNLATLFSSDDYPTVALREDQSGTVKFVLMIDESGSVVDCTVTGTSGVAVLDSQTCVVLKLRAKFEPALGPDGKPAKDAIRSRIIWKIAF